VNARRTKENKKKKKKTKRKKHLSARNLSRAFAASVTVSHRSSRGSFAQPFPQQMHGTSMHRTKIDSF
jgi:hypothetical protein